MSDRKAIIDTVLEDQPGPMLEEVEAPCGHCDENIVMLLDWASLLLG
jgi:ACT domain-containing protein